MLSRLIVSSYKPFIEIALGLTLFVSIVGGWQISRELFDGSIFVVIFEIAVWFIVAVVFFGAFLVPEDIRDRVKNIEASRSADPAPLYRSMSNLAILP